MPVPLPNPPAGPTPLPPAPQDPPTLTDISNAVGYNRQLLVSYDVGYATKDDIREGAVYQAALVSQHAGAAVVPPWFAPALAAGLAAGLAPLTRTVHITYNLQAGDGRSRPFKVVPFIDGTIPTHPPHNLPALTNIAVINELTGQQATAYLNGYNQPVPHLIADCRKAICIEIGCTAEV